MIKIFWVSVYSNDDLLSFKHTEFFTKKKLLGSDPHFLEYVRV